MVQATALAGNDQRINFINIFIRSRNITGTNHTQSVTPKRSGVESSILFWLENSSLLELVKSTTIRANEIFQTDQVVVKFQLSNGYRDQFVLFRGLLEFSRPKGISISADSASKTFELHLSDGEESAVMSYLDVIVKLFFKENSFKKSLHSVLRFEQSLKEQQSKLYDALKASLK